MWVENRANKSIVNMDWVSSIEIFYNSDEDEGEFIHKSTYLFEIRAYEKGSEGWFCFGKFETIKEVEQEFKKIKLKLNAIQ